MEKIIENTKFEQIIASEDPVIIKFYANWCPDCTAMNMFIGEVMEAFSDKKWYELNRDELAEPAEKYDVMGIPSILVFQKGEKVAHLHSANAKSPEEVQAFLSQTFDK